MTVPRVLNYISCAAVGLVFIVSGIVETTVITVYKEYIASESPDHPLPDLTLLALKCGSSHAISIFCITTGVVFSGFLFFLNRGTEEQRAYLPVCLTIALIVCWFQLLVVLVAMALPTVLLEAFLK